MERLVKRVRIEGVMKAAADALGWVLSLYTAAWVRLDFKFSVLPSVNFQTTLLISAVLAVISGATFGLYSGRWSYGSFDEISALVRSVLLSAIALFLVISFQNPRPVPRSSSIAGAAVALVVMAAFRYAIRLSRERKSRPDAEGPLAQKTVVFGAGNAGQQIVRTMLRDPNSRYVPVAILDDDPAKARLEINGVRVHGGRGQLVSVLRQTNATALLVAAPTASGELLQQVSAQLVAEAPDVKIKVLPPVSDLIDSTVHLRDIRDLSEEDLLGRRQVEIDIESIGGYIRGRRVLVTGAGGSIGSELCRQLHKFSPSELMMLDRDESALHSVQLSIEGRALLDSPNLILADIRDSLRLSSIWEQRRPEVVFHAAALKHLSLLEQYPDEAIKTNVRGTLNVLEASAAVGVSKFINISTDKAADPISVLGYSKRIAERLTADMAATFPVGTYLSVRFGNVLGSRGSFIHTFRAQIELGGPVTVTDREVTRYFMTIPEAVQLVVQAGAVGVDGEVLILDMGSPVRIADVARRMIRQSGREIEIMYTGLRSGEKLHEDLSGSDDVKAQVRHPLISGAKVPPLNAALSLCLGQDNCSPEKSIFNLRHDAFL